VRKVTETARTILATSIIIAGIAVHFPATKTAHPDCFTFVEIESLFKYAQALASIRSTLKFNWCRVQTIAPSEARKPFAGLSRDRNWLIRLSRDEYCYVTLVSTLGRSTCTVSEQSGTIGPNNKVRKFSTSKGSLPLGSPRKGLLCRLCVVCSGFFFSFARSPS